MKVLSIKQKALVGAFSGHCETSRRLVASSSEQQEEEEEQVAWSRHGARGYNQERPLYLLLYLVLVTATNEA